MVQITRFEDHELMQFAGADRDLRSKLSRFTGWLLDNDKHWLDLRMADYLEYLSTTNLSGTSITNHIHRVRGVYRRLLTDDHREHLWAREQIEQQYRASAFEAYKRGDVSEDEYRALLFPANIEAAISRQITHTKANVFGDEISEVVVQDAVDVGTWYNFNEVYYLARGLHQKDTVKHRRLAAMISLAFCFGLRASEVVAAKGWHLDRTSKGKSGLLIPRGKGNKQRFSIYVEEMQLFLGYVMWWREWQGIGDNALFPPLKTHGDELRVKAGPVSERTYQRQLAEIDAEAHDMRRSYARQLYEWNYRIKFIGDNMGHVNPEQTYRYIGLDMDGRTQGRMSDGIRDATDQLW